MYVVIGVHHPKAGMEKALNDRNLSRLTGALDLIPRCTKLRPNRRLRQRYRRATSIEAPSTYTPSSGE